MIKHFLFLVVGLAVAVAAVADDPAQANRLLVEAAKLAKAAEKEEEASDRLALLEGALSKLNEIIEHHPSSSLAVKLVTDQPIGSLSLLEITDTIDRLRTDIARQQHVGKEPIGGRHLAAVSENTNLILQIDFGRLAETPFVQGVLDIYRRYMERRGDEAESRTMEVLLTYLHRTEQVVLAADLTHVGDDDAVEQFASEIIVQFFSETGFEVASLMQALRSLRTESGQLLVRELVSEQNLGYEVSLPGTDDRFYVLPSPDAKTLLFGLRPEPLVAAMGRYVSGDLVDPQDLLQPAMPDAQISLGARLPHSMPERLKYLHLLEQFAGMRELPLIEILGNVFDIDQVFAEATIERHVALDLALKFDDDKDADIFFVLADTLILPGLELFYEGLFVSDPVLVLEARHLHLRLLLNGDTLLKWWETFFHD